MGNKVRKYKLKPWVRISIFLIFLFNVSVSAVLIHYGRHPVAPTKIDYSYGVDENLNYSVVLKDNEFYEEDTLGEGKQYATEIIDHINVNFDFNYQASKVTTNNINYEIHGTIIGEYENKDNGNAELWKKNYVLVDKINEEKESATFNIAKSLKIDYSKYSKVVEDFKSKFKIPIDAYLDVILKVDYDVLLDDQSIVKNTDTMEVRIPLAKTTINIEKKIDKHRDYSLSEVPVTKNKTLIRHGVFINLVSIAFFLLLSPYVFISNKTYYEKTLNRILKTFSEVIAEVHAPPSGDGLEVIDVKNFEDMVDIEEEIKSPILFYEIIKGSESIFTIVNGGYIYRYMLKK